MKITEIIENDYNQCFFDQSRGVYYASKPITIEIEINGKYFYAQTSDAMDYVNCHTITFNDSIDDNIGFRDLPENLQDEAIKICQIAYDEYQYPVNAFINAWAREADNQGFLCRPTPSRFFEKD